MSREPLKDLQLTDVRGIGTASAERLVELGATTVADLAAMPLEKLAGLPGFGPRRAMAVRRAALERLAAGLEPAPGAGSEPIVVEPAGGAASPGGKGGKGGEGGKKARRKKAKGEKDKKKAGKGKKKDEKGKRGKKKDSQKKKGKAEGKSKGKPKKGKKKKKGKKA